jgi:hypothetical protein
LTASVAVDRGTYLACAKSGGQRLDLGVIWQYDHRNRAYDAANIFEKAIAKHDAAVNAELIDQRDKLLKVCEMLVASNQGLMTLLSSYGEGDPTGYAVRKAQATIAEVEQAND